MATLVSAFIGNINVRADRSLGDYLNLGEHLLMVQIPKIVFIDAATYAAHYAHKTYELTRIIPVNWATDVYLHECDISNFSINTAAPGKDTLEFVCVQCMKTEWVKQAIELNCFGTTQFIWVDFGMYHFIQDEAVFNYGLHKMSARSYDTVRIPTGKPSTFPYFSRDVYHEIIWLFVGSVFGGSSESLIKFANLMKTKCLTLIAEKKHLMWEINVWYLIYYENCRLFDMYLSNHDRNMLFNY